MQPTTPLQQGTGSSLNADDLLRLFCTGKPISTTEMVLNIHNLAVRTFSFTAAGAHESRSICYDPCLLTSMTCRSGDVEESTKTEITAEVAHLLVWMAQLPWGLLLPSGPPLP